MKMQRLMAMVVVLLLIIGHSVTRADSVERERQIKECMENLSAIGAAVEAYRADHQGETPDWPSDLYPKYLQDTQLLMCSADETMGSTKENDPKMPCSYHYAFNPMKYTWGYIFDINPPKDPTYKEAMTMLLEYFGGLTPIVRCSHHGAQVLILGYDGKIYLSPLEWQRTPEAISAFISFLRGVMEDNPDDWEKKLSLKKIYSHFKGYKRLPDFRAILERQSNLSAHALSILAEIYHSEGEIDKAIETHLRLLRLDRDDTKSRYQLARLYAMAKNYGAARDQCQRIIQLEPDHSEAHGLLVELDAVQDGHRIQKNLSGIPVEDLEIRYLTKLEEMLFASKEDLKGTVTEAHDIARDSFGESAPVNRLTHLYKTLDTSFSATQGQWRTYSNSDGLVNDWVFAISQDDRGILWIGTWAGVCQYDGESFTRFPINEEFDNDWITSILVNRKGHIWFGSQKHGAVRYDGANLTYYTTANGLAGENVQEIIQDRNGFIWFAFLGGGVSRYDGKTFTNFTKEDGLAANQAYTIVQDSRGIFWVGTDSGVSKYDGKTFANLTEADGLVDNHVRAIVEDRDGNLWFGTDRGASRYDVEEFTSFTKKDGLTDSRILSILADREGNIWSTTQGDGVFRYDGKTFTNFTKREGLPGNWVRATFEDREGNIWFGHGTAHGLSKLNPRGLKNYGVEDGLPGTFVISAAEDAEGNFWISTDGGICVYDGSTFTQLIAESNRALGPIYAILVDSGNNIWFGTWENYHVRASSLNRERGVIRFDGTNYTRFTTLDGLVGNCIARNIIEDKNGNIWISAGSSRVSGAGGVSRYDGKGFTNFTMADGLGYDDVFYLNEDNEGNIWIGTWGGGVSRYDGTKFTNFTTDDGLVSDLVSHIFTDSQDQIWVATMNGLSMYDGTSFRTQPQFAGKSIWAILEGRDGCLWFGGDGVARTDGNVWAHITTEDGLPNKDVDVLLEDKDGNIWIGTHGGLTRYMPNPIPPLIHIESVEADRTYSDLTDVSLPSGTKYLGINYRGISFRTRPEAMQYLYQLEGHDDDWRGPVNERSVDYLDMKPGKYTFRVKVVDMDLNYSEPASLEIKILPPPFYTRAGFIGGSILAAFLIPTIIYVIMLTRQKKQEFEPLSNPYIVGNPIRSKDMFFGRKSDFEFIRIKLSTEEAGLVIVFAGARRSGKTSILFQILNGELGERMVPVLLDMQAMTVDSEAEFFEKMAAGIGEALVGVGLEPGSANFHEGNSTRVFEQFVAQTMTKLEGRGLLLLFDEYELIESKIDEGVLRSDIATFFASLLEAHPRLSLIFTGSQHLEGRNVEHWRILIGKSLYRRISFLSERDALRLIAEPVADRVIYPRGIPDRIIRLTAGQPFYTQVVCQNMMDRLNEMERNRVRQEDLDAVAQELADNPLPQMIYFWDGLEQEQWNALSLLGEVMESPDNYASALTLLDFAQKQDLELDIEPSDLEKTLDELFVNEVLERERGGQGKYEYRFRADLFRLWIRQAHSVWQ